MRRARLAPAALVAFVVGFAILLLPHLAHAAGDVAAAGDSPFSAYQERGWAWMYLASFGFGFLTSLTPCVYPMIPITLGIFGARGKDVSRGRALALAAAYVVGMGLTYAVLGVSFALLGGQFGSLLANPFVVIPIVLLFCLLAASMFGAFELNLPLSWQNKLNQVGGSGFGGAFAMGLVGGFIAAPCTGPFLAGLLAFVASTGSVIGGGSLLFVYALGMGVLFFVIAAFAMSLPKSGKWMDNVKSAGGILLLVGALYFLRPIVPFLKFALPAAWFLGASLALVLVGVLLGAVQASFHGPAGEKARKGLGIALVLLGVLGAWGWYLAPKHHLAWVWGNEGSAYGLARAQHKGVMVDFAASWCTPCEELERTFGDDDVYAALSDNFVPLKFDVSDGNATDLAHRKAYGAQTLPAVVFLNTDGEIIGRVDKLSEPAEFLTKVAPAIAKLHATK